ncbi:MAG TPA: hypothetical protein VF786_10570 [Terriglobales bacterium]
MKRVVILAIVLLLTCAAGVAQNCAMPTSKDQAQPATLQPPRTLQRYSASLTIDLKDQRKVEQQAWQLTPQKKGSPSKKVPLTPADGYVRCMIPAGGDVLRFGCASGFRPVNPVQTPPNPNGIVEDTPSTSGTTLQAGTVNTVTYDCVRSAVGPHHKPNAKK